VRTRPNPTYACAGWSPREPNASACLDRVNEATIKSIDPARTWPHVTQPFFGVAQSFYYIVSHFNVMNSDILLQWTQTFCYNELSHFTSMNSTIFVILFSHFFTIVKSVIFTIVLRSAIFSTVLSHFIIFVSHFGTVKSIIFLWCLVILVNSVILRQWTQPFATVLSYFAIVNPVIFCYSGLNYFVTMLDHFIILWIILKILPGICYNAYSFLLKCSIILVNSVILRATTLNYFQLSYNVQLFSLL
jgi:hypothetical protein